LAALALGSSLLWGASDFLAGLKARSTPAAAVVGEAMVAIVMADAVIEKFGGDSIEELVGNWKAFKDRTGARFTRT